MTAEVETPRPPELLDRLALLIRHPEEVISGELVMVLRGDLLPVAVLNQADPYARAGSTPELTIGVRDNVINVREGSSLELTTPEQRHLFHVLVLSKEQPISLPGFRRFGFMTTASPQKAGFFISDFCSQLNQQSGIELIKIRDGYNYQMRSRVAFERLRLTAEEEAEYRSALGNIALEPVLPTELEMLAGLLTQPKDPKWLKRIACGDANPEIFHPPWIGTAYQEAREYCIHCPVRVECLHNALVQWDPDGISGGLTPEERSIVRKRAIRLGLDQYLGKPYYDELPVPVSQEEEEDDPVY